MSLLTIEGFISRIRINALDEGSIVVVLDVQKEEDCQVFQQQHVSVDSQHPSVPFLCARAIVRVQGRFGADSQRMIHAEAIDLVRCAPHASAIAHVMDRVLLEGTLPDWTLPLSKEQLETSLDANGRRATISNIVRILKSGQDDRDPRKKASACPKRADFELFEEIERRGTDHSSLWKLLDVTKQSNVMDCGSPACVPSATANGYWNRRVKNQPEVQWITNTLLTMKPRPQHIVDVGGGRGDLATDIITRLKGSIVTVVDKQVYAARELSESVNFVHADFSDFMQDRSSSLASWQSLPPIDFVIAFHACGNLSDLAIDFAKQQSCSFLVCPCCYNKRCIPDVKPSWHRFLRTEEEVELLEELAELRMMHHISMRARRVINSIRLENSVVGRAWVLRLEEYEENDKSSSRNMVLIGEKDLRCVEG